MSCRKITLALLLSSSFVFVSPLSAIVGWTQIAPDTSVLSFDGRDRTPILLLADNERIEIIQSSIASSQSRSHDIALGVDGDSLAYELEIEDFRFDPTPVGIWKDRHVFLLRPPQNQTASTCTLAYSGRCEIVSDSQRSEIVQFLIPRRTSSKKAIAPISISNKGRLKIWVSREGIHRLFRHQIEKAGWRLTQSDLENMRMVGPNGHSVPIRIAGVEDGSFDGTDWIEFWAGPVFDYRHADGPRLNVWSKQAVYWLEIGDTPGPQMVDQGGLRDDFDGNEQIARYYPDTLHVEEDKVFNRLPYARDVDASDCWLYNWGVQDGEKWETSFQLEAPDTSAPMPATIRVRLRVQAVNPLDQNERPVEIFLNYKRVGQFSLPSMQASVAVSDGFDPSILKEGKNSFTFVNSFSGNMTSRVYLDWFEVDYPHSYTAVKNAIHFRPPIYSDGMKRRFQIEGFTEPDVEVYRIGVGRMTARKIDAVTDSLKQVTYRVQFDDFITDSNAEYIALPQSAKCTVDSAAWRPYPEWVGSFDGADYLVILPGDSLWSDAATPLIQLRERQGLHTGVFDINEIFDVFSGGIPDPEGLRFFFQYALDFWTIKPRFVLLTGGGLVSTNKPEAGDLIPVPLYQTYKYGSAPADHAYSLLDNDPYPDLAIGRLPVRNRHEFESAVSKIVGYEACPPTPWMNRYLLISSDAPGGVFSNQAESLIHDVIPPALHPERLRLNGPISDPNVGGTDNLLKHLRDGMAMINFRGHGGGAIWADQGLLKLDDIENIENTGRLPFITSMTCFTGDFTIYKRSLGVALFLAENKGAAGFWGSTGVGWTYADYDLLTEFYRELKNSPNLTVGEWIQRAKTIFLFNSSDEIALSDAYQYTLLGDPAMRLAIPRETVAPTANERAFDAGDTLLVSGAVEAAGMQGSMEITARDFSAIASMSVETGTDRWKSGFVFPRDFSEPETGARLHLWNEGTGFQVNGFVPIRFGQLFFDSLRTIPENPGSTDSLGFSVWIEDQRTPLQVSIVVLSPITQTLELEPESSGSSRYSTPNRIGPFPAGTLIRFFVEGVRSSGSVSRSDTVSSAIRFRDLTVRSVRLSGDSCVMWTASIVAAGFDDGVSIPVRFERDEFSPVIATAVLHDGSGDAAVAIEPGPGIMEGKITADPDQTFQDDNRNNNQFECSLAFDRFNITPSGSQWAGQIDTIRFNDRLAGWVPSGAVEKPATLNLTSSDSNSKPGLSQGAGPFYSIRFSGIGQTNLKMPMVLVFSAAVDSAENLSPFHWNQDNNRWTIMPCQREAGRIITETREQGEFCLAVSSDDRPPRINVLHGGRGVPDGGYVSRNPVLSILIEDESGVDKRPGQVRILLDEKPMESIPSDTVSTPNRLMVDLRPNLETGDHSIEVTASDVYGNQSSFGPIRFQIASRFELQFLGNHPNPFDPARESTVFAYLFTGSARKAVLTVYTVSGRRIRTFQSADMLSADYHEIEWDGRDQWGGEVANGVYFFRLQAESGQERREITGKIAIIR